MTKLINISRLAKPTAVLVASAALMSSAATAKGDHHQSSNVQKHRPPPSLRDQQLASQREESDALPKRKRWRKEEGVRKNYCSHSRMWSELQKSEWAGGWF